MNGTLSISPSNPASDSVTNINSSSSDSFSVLGGLSIEPVSVPNNDSVTVTPAHNGANVEPGGNLLQGIDSGNSGDPLNLLQGLVSLFFISIFLCYVVQCVFVVLLLLNNLLNLAGK